LAVFIYLQELFLHDGLEEFIVYLQHGKYYLAIVFYKAYPQRQAVGKDSHLVSEKENPSDCCLCSQHVPERGPPHCFSAPGWIPSVDMVTWRRAELLCEHQSVKIQQWWGVLRGGLN
jgi:hypothetical protein